MRRTFGAALGLLCCTAAAGEAADFAAPVRLTAGGKAIRVESPGYACPSWADVDGSGKMSLVVGQFAQGKMKAYRSLGDGKFADGNWIRVDGRPAEVPGVW